MLVWVVTSFDLLRVFCFGLFVFTIILSRFAFDKILCGLFFFFFFFPKRYSWVQFKFDAVPLTLCLKTTLTVKTDQISVLFNPDLSLTTTDCCSEQGSVRHRSVPALFEIFTVPPCCCSLPTLLV